MNWVGSAGPAEMLNAWGGSPFAGGKMLNAWGGPDIHGGGGFKMTLVLHAGVRSVWALSPNLLVVITKAKG